MNNLTLKVAISALCLSTLPTIAAERITYDKLDKESLGDASPRSLINKIVEVPATSFSELGFVVRKNSYMRFVCTSGDKSLTGNRPKAMTFEGTTVSAQGWDGLTIWTLANCQPFNATSTKSERPEAPSATNAEYVAGGKNWSGSVLISERGNNRAKVTISTAAGMSTCDLEGTARFSDVNTAKLTTPDAPSCRADLKLSATSIKVKTVGCEQLCGARGPGFDFEYWKK